MEGCVRWEDRRAKQVARDEFLDAGDELADSAEEYNDTDKGVWRLDPAGMRVENRHEEDASGKG